MIVPTLSTSPAQYRNPCYKLDIHRYGFSRTTLCATRKLFLTHIIISHEPDSNPCHKLGMTPDSYPSDTLVIARPPSLH